ncbi:MAG: hypothetical protein ACON5A_00665 [Candidatus Comchoanobacterales bacterium]
MSRQVRLIGLGVDQGDTDLNDMISWIGYSWQKVLKLPWFINENIIQLGDVNITQDDIIALGSWANLENTMNAQGWSEYQKSAWYALLLLVMVRRRVLNGWHHYHLGGTSQHRWQNHAKLQLIHGYFKSQGQWRVIVIGKRIMNKHHQSITDVHLHKLIKSFLTQQKIEIATFWGDHHTISWQPWVDIKMCHKDAWNHLMKHPHETLYIHHKLRPRVGVYHR